MPDSTPDRGKPKSIYAPTPNDESQTQPASRRGRVWFVAALFLAVALATAGLAALLVTIFEHRQEALTPFVRLVEVNEVSTDPVTWGTNWPHEFDSYRRTA